VKTQEEVYLQPRRGVQRKPNLQALDLGPVAAGIVKK